jgi:lipopolysaccharide export system protein LptC
MAVRPIDDIGIAAEDDAFGVAPREDAFRTAYRHSRRVRRLRFIVPILAVSLFSGVVFISWWDPLKALNLPVAIGAVSVSGSKVTMEAPRLTGYSNDNRFYRVAATKAEHDIAEANMVALSAIDAEMELEGGGTARVVSSAGQLDTKTGQIEFNQTVSLTMSNGQSGRAGHALVDTRAGTIRSNGPVEMSSPRGDLAADRLHMRENGKVIVLEGNVRGNFMPEPPDPTLAGDQPQLPAASPNATSR